MKKFITLAAIVATMFTYAQDNGGHVISVNGTYANPYQAGISYEREGKALFIKDKEATSSVLNASYAGMNYEADGFESDGTGFVIEYGSRAYFNKENKFNGLYYANYLSYGMVNFEEAVLGETIDGTYSYFSFFSPEFGYKLKFGNFVVDPFIGAMWKIEIKGDGFIDNKNTEEWAFRGGLKIGYQF